MVDHSETLPNDLQTFILKNLHSVEQVEILLLLFHDPSRYWTASQVDARIRTNILSVKKRLHDLKWRGLIESSIEDDEERFRFLVSAANSAACSAFSRYYGSHQTRIIEMIYSRPPEAIGYFANAFRIR